MKLNKRLLMLSKMVKKPYCVAWDCCCDHGLLGIKILSDGLVKQVNFVDQVPDIMTELQHKLTQYGHKLPLDCQWHIFCQDVAAITLIDTDNIATAPTKQLVIISGVGGELILTMLTRLMAKYSGKDIDFLLCPVHHTYALRQGLVNLNFSLIEEQLVFENNRGYELLLVNQSAAKSISLIGKSLWQQDKEHRIYLQKLISHYQRMRKSRIGLDNINQPALEAYQALYREYYE